MAWRTPPLMSAQGASAVEGPEGSTVPWAQSRLREAAHTTLAAIGRDVQAGLSETVGIKSTWVEGERASVVIELPPDTDAELIARAIDMENVEAWCDEEKRVHVAIDPWYSTKDVDQVVLSITKVVHVMLGLHASDVEQGEQSQPKGFLNKLLASAMEVMHIQKRLAQKKDTHAD